MKFNLSIAQKADTIEQVRFHLDTIRASICLEHRINYHRLNDSVNLKIINKKNYFLKIIYINKLRNIVLLEELYKIKRQPLMSLVYMDDIFLDDAEYLLVKVKLFNTFLVEKKYFCQTE